MIVYIYNIGVDLYNGFNGLRHRINWTYFTVLDGLAHPLYSAKASTIYFSLIESAKMNKLNPYKYLEYVLDTLSTKGLSNEIINSVLPYSKQRKRQIK